MIQRRILAAVALLCAFSATAHAQPYTKAQLNAQVGVNFPDNTSFLITPQNVRTITDNIINSIMPTAPVVSGNVACYNGTTGLLKDCGSAPPLNPFKVKVQRTNTSGAAVWGAYDAFGNFLTACSTSTTACVQAAVNLAFPYASGTTALGYDFEIIGGNDPANGAGHNFGGGATGMQVTAPLQFPPIQGGKITIGAISFSGTINDGVIFDSCEMCTIDFRGAQISYHNLGGTSYAIRVKPTQGTPLDGNFGFSPAKMYGQSINGRMRFDLSGATSANITNSLVDIDEVNGSTLSTGCIFQQDSPATGQNVTQNEITFRQLHGIAAGMTAFCDGNGAPGSGAVLGNSIYHITMSPDATNSANGIDSWGSDNKWFIQAAGFSTGFTLKFESGACKNTAFITSDQASPIVTDASGCTGANANIIFVNGALTIANSATVLNGAGLTAPQITGTQAGAGINSPFIASSNQPAYAWQNTASGTDAKTWDALAGSSSFQMRAVNDAQSVANPWVNVTRSGTTITKVQFPDISDLTSTAHSVALGQATGNFSYAANGTAGFVLYASGASTDPAFAQCLPNIQSFTSGSAATYTTPSCTINGQSVRAAQLDIELWGGGAGGGGGGTSPGNGGSGNTTSISTFTATGGAINAGGGGSCTGSPNVLSLAGGTGGAATTVGVNSIGGPNGTAPHYGASAFGTLNGAGAAAGSNTGSGGAGGGSNSSTAGGAGGSGGGFCRTIVSSPAATYTYTVAATAAGGTAGTSGNAGGGGAAGGIIVTARWQ